MKLQELTERLTRQQRRRDKVARAIERTEAEIEQVKQQKTTPVVVAGLNWGAYLTPSEQCKEPAHYNEKTGLWYFSQQAAILHAYEQNLRLPTAAEYQQLYDSTTLQWSEQNGVKGTLFTDKVTDESVFFPASGYRYTSNGAFYGVTAGGYYWSSSVYNATGGLYLYFGSGRVYPQNYSNRSYGFPVRCVASVPHTSQQ